MQITKKVLVTADLDKESIELITNSFVAVLRGRAAGGRDFLSEIHLTKEIETFQPEILIISAEPVTERVLNAANQLKLIAVTRGDPVNVDLDACKKRGIIVTNTPARNANSVAELTIALIICSARNVFKAVDSVKNGTVTVPHRLKATDHTKDIIWFDSKLKKQPYIEFQGVDISGRSLGLIGFGAIGRKVAEKANCLGMRIIAYDPNIPAEEMKKFNVERALLDELLCESDFVSIHCKLTSKTEGMIGKREFEIMKSSAFLINTARAGIVNREALYQALKKGQIMGAAFDVFYYEPIAADDPFLNLCNFVITPHIGGASRDVRVYHSRMILKTIMAYVNGDRIPYRIT